MAEEKKIYSEIEAKTIISDFLENTESVKNDRAGIFQKYQRFVIDGEQWSAGEKPEGDKPCLTFNQSEDHITTFLSKLFPRNMQTGNLKIGVKVSGENKEECEKEILKTYNDNEFATTVLEQGQNFLVGGAGCFYYPKNPVTGQAKIISLDPAKVYLNWSGQDLLQMAFEDEITLADVETSKNTGWLLSAIKLFLKNETEASRRFKKTKRITYWDKTCQIIKIDNSYKVTANEDGLIPLSWIPNSPKAHTHEGTPEAKKLYNLEKEYNKRASDFAQRVKSNTKAILATFTEKTTAELDNENLHGILPFGTEDRAEFLKLEENREILDYLEMISKKMATKMAINDAVQGSVKSNVSSLSMVYYFSPLMDRIGLKRVYWDKAFRELNRAILTYKFGHGSYEADPVYEPIVLTDIKTKIENNVLMLENNLISHLDAIDELRGNENANKKLEEILIEKKKFESQEKKEKPPVL